MGIFIPTSPGCDEDEGEFGGSLPSTASDRIVEDEYKMLLEKANHAHWGWGLPSTAGAPSPPWLCFLLTYPLGWWGRGQMPLLHDSLRGSLGPLTHVISSSVHSFIPLTIHPLTNND